MSLETSSTIFTIIMVTGFLVAIYYLIKDRVSILRSLKPNSWEDFFSIPTGVYGPFSIRRYIYGFMFNLLALLIWGPVWILDKLFRLKIFEENNRK